MKVVIATMKGGLDDVVSPVFGRCATYTIVETEGKEIKDVKTVENPSASATGGAGIKAAQFVANETAEYVVAGNFGPNAAAVLMQAGVKMIQAQGSVKDTVDKIVSGELKPTDGPTVQTNFGKGFGRGQGGGRGMGRSGGRGGGMGRGGRRQ